MIGPILGQRGIRSTATVWLALALMLPAEVIGKDADADLAVRIVPNDFYSEKLGRSIERNEHFHVVLTNQTRRSLRLWKEWCSWGYFNLSFEVHDEDGRVTKMTKAPSGWDRNFPDWIILAPGDHFVIDVKLDESVWQGIPAPSAPKRPPVPRVVRLKAIFEIRTDEEAVRNAVWTGRAASTEDSYNLW